MRIFRYAVVGGLTTLVNFVMFWLLKDICGIEMNTANSIAVVISIIFAYVTNKIFVFRSKTHGLKALAVEMVSFLGSRVATMLLDIGTILVVHTVLGVDEKYSMITKVIVNAAVIILNFVFSQAFVFKHGEK
ncbi:MAG: GtrA family protein [Oscillospiraceae bacterium]|jgi:putative flippase GtrA|nr:GtrA family protein [Oscillospiraceae bacterium]